MSTNDAGAGTDAGPSTGADDFATAYRPGSVADFDRLYRNAYPRLKRTITAILADSAAAEDCVQDAFVRAFRAWPRWKPVAPAEMWVHRIALNRAFSYRRRMALEGIGETLRRLGRPEPPPDPADALEWDELKRALRRLPPKVAAAVVLRHYCGYTNRDIAKLTGISERMVGFRLSEGQRRLRADLGGSVDAKLPTMDALRVHYSGGHEVKT
jgi:RNA polymerase sigma-70 factor (ECF subfamily)